MGAVTETHTTTTRGGRQTGSEKQRTAAEQSQSIIYTHIQKHIERNRETLNIETGFLTITTLGQLRNNHMQGGIFTDILQLRTIS